MEREHRPLDAASCSEQSDPQGTERKVSEENPQSLSPNTLKTAATECLNSWIFYLQELVFDVYSPNRNFMEKMHRRLFQHERVCSNEYTKFSLVYSQLISDSLSLIIPHSLTSTPLMLNSVCTAGVRLSQSLHVLSQAQNLPLASRCQASWEELTKVTSYASHTVKAHIAAAMQDMVIGETFTEDDAQRQQDHNQLIISEHLLTFINLQYQFSIASCENLGAMAMCPSCQTNAGGQHDPECSMATLQQCFAQLYTQEVRSQTSSPHFPTERGLVEGHDMSKIHYTEYPRQQSPLNPNPELHGSYPYQETYGPSTAHGFMDTIRGPGHIETIRGPFPNPGQLFAMKSPFRSRGSRSPLHFPLFPLVGQRRWSEAAAGEVSGDVGDGTMRRWSMPWDCGKVEAAPWQQKYIPSKLAVPHDRSRSTTPEAVATQQGTIPSGEGLAEAIQLLSCRPIRCAIPQGPLHGVSYAPTPWSEPHEERLHRRMFTGPLQRGPWQSIDVPQASGMSVTEHYDIFPPGLPLTSRKSSSSTDSSSCLSIHSRSTTSSSERGSEGGGGDAVRLHTNLYSIWSGSDHLPFIRLPESQEPLDDSDTENTPTDQGSQSSLFPKPT